MGRSQGSLLLIHQRLLQLSGLNNNNKTKQTAAYWLFHRLPVWGPRSGLIVLICSLLLVWYASGPEANWGRKYLFHLTVYSPSWRKSRQELEAGTQGLELKQKPWKNTDYWLALYGLLRTTWQGMAPPTVGWAAPYHSIIEKMPHRFLLQTARWRQSLN